MVHQYKLNGYNIVIDVYSGAVHVVDDVAYDIIRLFCEKTKDEIVAYIMKNYGHLEDVTEAEVIETYEDVVSLKKAGKLFTEDIYEPKASVLKNRHTDIKALCLHVAHTCDLTCSYCFAGQGRFKGKSALMSKEIARRAIDFLIENSGSRRNLEVDFFGGEPLLNFDVVKDTVAYARSIEKEHGKNFRFTLTTNGMGINDEVIEFANKECHNVVLSLDGRKEVHDRERTTADGKGSYDVIVPKFQKLVESRGGKGYYIRGTYTKYNTDFTEDIKQMLDLGFDELSLEPVVCEPDSEFALSNEDLPVIFEQYEKLAKEMIERHKQGKDFTFYHYMIDLNHGPCIYKRISGCGSGTEYFAVTPQGDLYPCHQFVGEPEYLMGNIFDGIKRDDIKDEFKMCNVYAREDCRDCWAKLYCSGGCAANGFKSSGDIRGVYEFGCELFKKRMECAIMKEIAISEI